MNRIRLSMWLVFFACSGIAQEPRFIQHDIGDENAGLAIHTIIQDNQCMIWLGTARGLARYDGNAWHPVQLGHPDSAYQVSALFEDASQRIWIGTSSGKIFYLDRFRKMHPFDVDEGCPQKSISAIVQDPQGNIWFSTYGEGAYVYTGSRLFNFDSEDGLSGEDIYTMICTPDGEVWLGTDDGITICTFEKETKRIRQLGLKDGLPDQIITALKADQKGNVWIGTFEFGVVFFDASTRRISRPFETNQMDKITSFAIFDEHEIWIGTNAQGVWRHSIEDAFAKQLVGLQNFKQGQVSGLLSDVEGNIWIVMLEGVLISGFRPFESLTVDVPEIQTIYTDQKDQLWIGTKSGLFRVQENPTEQSKPIRVLSHIPLNITDMLEDRFHHLWIGTIDKGLYVFDPVTSNVKHLGSIIEKGGFTIMSMAATSREIWVTTLEGVVSYPADQDIFKESSPEFQLLSDPWQSNLHFVFQVYVDSRDRAWFATDGKGVFCIDGDQVTQHVGNDSFEIKTVYSVCEDHKGHLWFNTADQGLVEFDGMTYKPLGVKEGLGNLNMASINTCSTGDILITHGKGIDIMEPARRHFMYYNEEIGIEDLAPGLNASAVNSKGHVYTSGQNKIFKYYSPKNKLSIHPRTQLTAVSVFDKEVDFSTENHFSHGQNYISFSYVGLWYTSPSSVKYLYKLDGYDLQWKESKDNTASYSNLAPGDYTFSVKASENNFFLDEPIASYSFSIAKPFWRKFWFIGLMTFFSIAALYWLIKSRERRSGRQALLKKDMIESQLSALKAQINPHFLFNSFNTLITIIDENPMKPEVGVEYVEKLSDFYRSILQYREQEYISLEEEWELVQNFTYLLEKRYGNNLRLHMDPPQKEGFILPMTLQMLVENAVKHNIISEKYPLDLFITCDEDGYVTVKNSLQPKSKPEPSTQFGLQSIIRRYQLLSDRKVIIEKNDSSFIVRIPIIKKSNT
ncbi:MAG: histidine kinase [Saprospiraceae bacterium]|nr:histidine kinase [Candidatus Opimibacter skivensis]